MADTNTLMFEKQFVTARGWLKKFTQQTPTEYLTKLAKSKLFAKGNKLGMFLERFLREKKSPTAGN